MSAEQEKWDRLVKLARQAPKAADPEMEMPLGFATRVVANWPRITPLVPLETLWERLSLRFIGVALAILLITVGVSYPTIAADNHEMLEMTDSVLESVFEP